MRLPGTFNWKNEEEINLVFPSIDDQGWQDAPYPLTAFDCLLDEAMLDKKSKASNGKESAGWVEPYSDTAGRYYALALNAIKDDIDDRTTWRNIGMALHSLSWDDKGYELWTAWSKQSDKFDEDDQRRTWDSFKHDRENGRLQCRRTFR